MKTQKILSAFILGIFLISMMPLAFADNTNVVTDTNTINDNSLPNSAQSAQQENKEQEIKTRLAETQQQRTALAKQIQKRAENLVEAKKRLIENKKELRRVCADSESDACNAEKRKTKENAKDILTKTADKLSDFIERTEKRIETMQLSEETKKELLQELTQSKEEIQTLKDKIESMNYDATAEQYKEISQELKAKGKELKSLLKDIVQKTVTKKTHDYAKRMLGAINGIEQRIDKLQNAGADTSKIEALLAQFKEQLAKVELYEGAEAAKQLRIAHKTMTDILHALSELQKDISEQKREERTETRKEKQRNRQSDDDSDIKEKENEDTEDDDSEDSSDNTNRGANNGITVTYTDPNTGNVVTTSN